MTKRSEKMSFRIEHDLRKRVDNAAAATKRSPSELMRDALEREVLRSLSKCEPPKPTSGGGSGIEPSATRLRVIPHRSSL